MINFKKLYLPAFHIIQTIILSFVLLVSSCESCGSSDPKKATNLTGILKIEFNKDALSAAEEDVKLTIHSVTPEEIVNLEKFTLKLFYEIGSGEISYKDLKGNIQREQAVQGKITRFLPVKELTPDNPQEITFHIKGNPDITSFTVIAEIYDDEANQTVDKQAVTWNKKDEEGDLAFIGLPENLVFVDKEAVKFSLKNNGTKKISTDDIQFEFDPIETDIIFKLGQKIGHHIHATLTQILGLKSAKYLAKGEESDQIILKLEDPKAKIASAINLIVKYEGKELKRQISWKSQSSSFEFLHLPDNKILKSQEEARFKIKNKGVQLSTDDVQIQFVATNQVSFSLGKKKGDSFSATVTEILGTKQDLAKDAYTPDIVLQLEDPNNQQNSTITLTVYYKGISQQKIVKWQAGKLEIIGLHTFAGLNKAAFQLKNETSGVINPKDIVVELSSAPSDLELEFIRGYTYPVPSPATLEQLLGNNTPINFEEQTPYIHFRVKNQPAIQMASVTVTIKNIAGNTELNKKAVTWTSKNINLNIDNTTPTQLQGTDKTKFKVSISNSGSEKAEATLLQLQLRRIQGTAATIAGITEKAGIFKVDLASLGDIDKFTNINTEEMEIVPHTDKIAVFECQLLYNDYPVGDKKLVTWKGDAKIKLTSTDPILTGDNKTTYLSFTNESGFELNKEILETIQLKLNNVTNGAKVNYDDNEGKLAHFDENRPTTLANLLGIQLADNEPKYVALTIDTGMNAEAEFEVELLNSVGLQDDKKVKILWKGEPKIKVTTPKTSLGGSERTAQLTFINENGFKLDQTILKGITIRLNNLTHGAKVVYGKDDKDIDGANLVDVWEGYNSIPSANNQHITIIPGTNKSVSFELELIGSRSKENDKKLNFIWNDETKIQLTAKEIHLTGNEQSTEITFNNQGSFKLTKENLENIYIHVNKLTDGAQVVYGNSNKDIHGTKLTDILESSELNKSISKTIKIVPGKNQEVSFELELVGSSNTENDRKVTIDWEGGVMLKLEAITPHIHYLKGAEEREIKLKITNSGNIALKHTDLGKIKFSYEKSRPGKDEKGAVVYVPSKGKLTTKKSNLDINDMPLAQILDKNELGANSSQEISLMIDNEEDYKVEFRNLKLVGTDASVISNAVSSVEWEGEDKVDLKLEAVGDLTQLVGEQGKNFKIKITNNSVFTLGGDNMSSITNPSFSYVVGSGSDKKVKLVKKGTKQDIDTQLILDLLDVPILKAGETKFLELSIEDIKEKDTTVKFMYLALINAKEQSEINPIVWHKR